MSSEPRGAIAALFLALFVSAPCRAVELSEVIDGLERRSGTVDIGDQDLARLLDYGIERELMIFEVFNAVVLHLEHDHARAHISGSTLRRVAAVYDLGGDRVLSLLPVEKVAHIYLGNGGPREAPLEVYLDDEHAQFLEVADITLSRHYGFRQVGLWRFDDGFGASVRRMIFGLNLDSIEIYEKNKIAIRVNGVGRPKRWRIDRISRMP